MNQGFKTAAIDHGQRVGIEVEVVERNPAVSGFAPQSKGWVVEQVNGIMMDRTAGWHGTTSIGPPPPSRGCTEP